RKRLSTRWRSRPFEGHGTHVRVLLQRQGCEGRANRAGTRCRTHPGRKRTESGEPHPRHRELIKASDGFHIWSERYDREPSDIFAVQDELSSAITGALTAKLSVKPQRRKQYTADVAAYEA